MHYPRRASPSGSSREANAVGHPLLAMHERWLRGAFDPDVEIAALSCPRGSAKTYLAARLAALTLTPGSALFEPGHETLAVSASLEQSRTIIGFCRELIGADRAQEYRFLDSGQRLAITHKASGAKLRILSSSGRRAMGQARFGTIIADEPGSWQAREGLLLYHALRQSLGKRPGQRLLLIGTRSPADPGTWWPSLLEAGSGDGVHVTVMSAPDGSPWDAWPTIRAANPMVLHNSALRRRILRERDEARRNPSMRPAFEAYRLNRLVNVSNEMLCTVEQWRAVERRAVPERPKDRPIVGFDLGSERSWSAAWALFANGRAECYAVCPGIPDLAERERQDAVPSGLYRRLRDDGVLVVDGGRRVSEPDTLIDHLLSAGIRPGVVMADRFNRGRLIDAVAGRWPLIDRVARWSEATEDITSFRRLVLDGPLSIHGPCRALAVYSLSQAVVEGDRQGSVRLLKRRHSRSRDDVAVAATLAAGRFVKLLTQPKPRAPRFSPAWTS